MIPISVGVSGLLSAEWSPNQSVDEASVSVNSIYHEYSSNDNFANSTWESPANVLVVHEDIDEIGSNTDDAFSDWLRSHSESGPAEAAVDLVSLYGSDSAPSSLGCGDYDADPQRPHGPMPSDRVSVSTSPCQLSSPPPLVAPYISAHEISSIISYSRSPLSATLIFSQSAENFSSPTIQSAHEVESKDDVAIPTPESLAHVSEVQNNEIIDAALSAEVFAGSIGEHALSVWPSSYFKFYTEENSKESYSAVQSNPLLAEFDSNDECEVLAARASSRVRKAIDSMREASNQYSDPSLFTAGPLEPHVPTPLSRDPQPSSFLESPSSSLDSITSLSILPTALSVSSSSLFVLSSSLPSSCSSLCASPVSTVSFHDQVPLPPSISLFSFPSALSLSPVSLSVYDPSPVSCLVPVFLPCASVSDVFLPSSRSAECCSSSSVTHICHFDVVQPSPIERPPEDPPPDIADELKDWFRAYMGLDISEPALPSTSCLLPTSNNSSDLSNFLVPTNEFEEDVLPFADVVEDSPLCSQDSYNAFPVSRSVWSHPHPGARPVYDEIGNDDERDFRSCNSLSPAVPSSTSFDDSRSTPGYGGDSSSPTTGLEIDTSPLCSQALRNVAHGFRSDPAPPSRVTTLDLSLQSGFAQPLHNAPVLDKAPDFATCTPTGVVWLADLSPADEYNPQSEPEPPDPSCASQ